MPLSPAQLTPRNLAALLGVGALTLSLAACGDDDRIPGQLGQEPEPADQETEEPQDEPEDNDTAEEFEENDAAEDPAAEEPEDEPEEPLDDNEEDPFSNGGNDNGAGGYTGDFEACDLLSVEELNELLGEGYDIEMEAPNYSETRDICEWSWEHSGDMWDYGFFSVTVTGPDDLVSNADVFESMKDSEANLGDVEELDGIGEAAFVRTDGFSLYILAEDHLISLNGAGIGGENEWEDVREPLAEIVGSNL